MLIPEGKRFTNSNQRVVISDLVYNNILYRRSDFDIENWKTLVKHSEVVVYVVDREGVAFNPRMDKTRDLFLKTCKYVWDLDIPTVVIGNWMYIQTESELLEFGQPYLTHNKKFCCPITNMTDPKLLKAMEWIEMMVV